MKTNPLPQLLLDYYDPLVHPEAMATPWEGTFKNTLVKSIQNSTTEELAESAQWISQQHWWKNKIECYECLSFTLSHFTDILRLFLENGHFSIVYDTLDNNTLSPENSVFASQLFLSGIYNNYPQFNTQQAHLFLSNHLNNCCPELLAQNFDIWISDMGYAGEVLEKISSSNLSDAAKNKLEETVSTVFHSNLREQNDIFAQHTKDTIHPDWKFILEYFHLYDSEVSVLELFFNPYLDYDLEEYRDTLEFLFIQLSEDQKKRVFHHDNPQFAEFFPYLNTDDQTSWCFHFLFAKQLKAIECQRKVLTDQIEHIDLKSSTIRKL